MRGLLALLLSLSACSAVQPEVEPTVEHEVILEVINHRANPVVVRIVPEVLELGRVPLQMDEGDGDGYTIEARERRTVRLPVMSEGWSLTVNGSPLLRSSDHDFVSGGWTAGELVVDHHETSLELEASQPAPSN